MIMVEKELYYYPKTKNSLGKMWAAETSTVYDNLLLFAGQLVRTWEWKGLYLKSVYECIVILNNLGICSIRTSTNVHFQGYTTDAWNEMQTRGIFREL